MASRDANALDRMFAALADPTRRAMVERLAKSGRLAISELAAPFTMSLPAVLKHVGVLNEAGLVTRVKIGRTVYCGLASAPLGVALVWLRKYEDYQAPTDPIMVSASAARGKARPARRPGAAKSEKQAPAAKTARKPVARTAPRKAARSRVETVAAKAKPATRRGGKAAAAASSTSGQRGARVVSGTRSRATKAQTGRQRPRR